MRITLTGLSLALPLLLAANSSERETAPEPAQDHEAAAALFVTHCASCHGILGDGEGTTDLDRKARSFKDGGFSFGNTPEALFRTLTTGIPGTPMPGFDGALSEDQRRILADYVVTLGPPPTEVDLQKTQLAVVDRPVFVRGMLPPLTPTGVAITRGLLLGLPTGQSFEYRTDDVRLLGVRQGAFVRRSDWTGRGGAGLEPLGKVVMVLGDGQPESSFVFEDGTPVRTRFRGTWVEGTRAGLTYDLLAADGHAIARVRESIRSRGMSVASGYTRDFEITGNEDASLLLRGPGWGSAAPEGSAQRKELVHDEEPGPGNQVRTWSAIQDGERSFQCRIGPWTAPSEGVDTRHHPHDRLQIREGATTPYQETRLLLSAMTTETLATLKQELGQ